MKDSSGADRIVYMKVESLTETKLKHVDAVLKLLFPDEFVSRDSTVPDHTYTVRNFGNINKYGLSVSGQRGTGSDQGEADLHHRERAHRWICIPWTFEEVRESTATMRVSVCRGRHCSYVEILCGTPS